MITALLTSNPGRWFAVTLFFSAATVIQTWPLVLHADDKITSWTLYPDAWVFVWDLWWVKYALLDLQTNPFHTDFLFFPEGTDLYLHTLATTQGVLSIPLQLATRNLFLSWNILGMLFFVFSALAAYALAYRTTHNAGAALISGYIFAFAPFVLMRFGGHWHMSTTWPIPLLALFLLRFEDTGRLREAAAAAVCWAMLTYNNLEYGLDAALFVGFFFLYRSVVHLQRHDASALLPLWRGFAVLAVVWLAVSAPLVLPALDSVAREDVFLPADDERYSSDLVALVTPSPLWGPGKEPAIASVGHSAAGTVENTVYLGIVPLILAGLAVTGVLKTPRRVIFWGIVFLIFVILALGPYLYIGDTRSFSLFGVSFSVPLPYQIVNELPVFGERRAPARMVAFGMLGLSVLAGIGFETLTSGVTKRWKGIRSVVAVPLMTVLILGLVILEYWNPPILLYGMSNPAVLEDIADEPGDFSVLEVPWGRLNGWTASGNATGAYFANLYQTLYAKPTFGGFISRTRQSDLDWVGQQAALSYLTCVRCTEPPPAAPEYNDPVTVKSLFRRHNIKYVLVHRLVPDGAFVFDAEDSVIFRVRAYLTDIAGMAVIYEDPELTVYRNPDIADD